MYFNFLISQKFPPHFILIPCSADTLDKILSYLICPQGLPRWLSSKESICNAGTIGDLGSIPGSGRSPGGGHGNPLQYSCLRIPWTKEPGGLQSMGS